MTRTRRRMVKTKTNRKFKIKQRKYSYLQSYKRSINVPFKPRDRQKEKYVGQETKPT